MNLVTGSRTLLTLACPPWSLLPAPQESSALSVEGQDVHAFVQRVAERFARHMASGGLWEMSESRGGLLATAQYEALSDVPERSRARCESLDLEPLAPFLRPGAFAMEVGIAYNPATGEAVRLPDGTREESYRGLDPAVWIGCKLDMLALTEDAVVVADLKGRWPDRDAARAQFATYALAAARCFGKERAVCYLLPCRDDGDTEPLRPWELDAAALKAHAEKLRESWRRRQVAAEALAFDRSLPDPRPAQFIGYLHLGPHCERCPARFACPARNAAPLALLEDGAVTLTAENAPKVFERSRAVRQVLDAVDEQLKAFAKRYGGIQLPDGRVYGAREISNGIEHIEAAVTAIAQELDVLEEEVEEMISGHLSLGDVDEFAAAWAKDNKQPLGETQRRVRAALGRVGALKRTIKVEAECTPCLPPEEES